MPTDELSFAELYDTLRDLRIDDDAPAGWHDAQRAALLSFIESGAVTSVRAERPSNGAEVLTLDAGAGPRPRHRTAVVLAVAAAVALLAAGLTVVPRWRGEEVPPATQPTIGSDGSVPFPDLYPVLPAGHPMESRVTAAFDGQFDWSNDPQSWMIVGSVVNDVVEQAVRISTTSATPAEVGAELIGIGSGAGEPYGEGGQWTLYSNVNDVMDVLVGPLGPGTLSVAGVDVVDAVEAMGDIRSIVDISVDERGPYLGAPSLPDRYRVIAGPESIVPGAMSATLTIPDGEGPPDPTLPDPIGDEGDGLTVSVTMIDPFLMPLEGLRRVDIGDREGWASTVPGAPMVAWKISETTWATVWNAANTQAALEFAVSLEFVDRTTWVERYAVPQPTYPAGPSPDTPTPVAPTAIVEPMLPDRFPIVPDDDPRAGSSSGGYGGVTGRDLADRMHAVVAIDDGARLTNGTVITADPTFDASELAGQTAVPMTVAGIEGSLFTNGETGTFVAAGTPTLLVQAADPVAFIEAAGRIPVVGAEVGPDGAATFALRDLPDGYSVAVAPAVPMTEGAVHAWTRMPVDDGAEILTVEVGPEAYAMRWVVFADFERVDVAGRPGWLVDRGGATVIWQVGERSWAILSGSNRDVALDAASAFEFVDRATWEQRYGAELVPMEAPPGTTVPAEDASRLDCRVIGRSPSNFDQRIEIDCGAAHGVLVGMPVVLTGAPDGGVLVGKVTEIASTTSVVMLVTDPQYSVQAAVGEVAGVLRGGGGDEPMEFATADSATRNLAVGDLVETLGGSDSLAPSGLEIGRVVGPRDVEPSADLSALETVTVLLYVPEREGA